MRVRFLLARDPELRNEVLDLLLDEVAGWLREATGEPDGHLVGAGRVADAVDLAPRDGALTWLTLGLQAIDASTDATKAVLLGGALVGELARRAAATGDAHWRVLELQVRGLCADLAVYRDAAAAREWLPDLDALGRVGLDDADAIIEAYAVSAYKLFEAWSNGQPPDGVAALRCIDEAIRLREIVLSRNPAAWTQELSITWCEIARSHTGSGPHCEIAKERAVQQFEKLEARLRSDPSTPGLAIAVRRLEIGVFHRLAGKADRLVHGFRALRAARDALAAEPGDRVLAYMVGSTATYLGIALVDAGRHPEAIDAICDVDAVSAPYIFPNAPAEGPFLRLVARANVTRARALETTDRAAARTCALRAIQLLERAAGRARTDVLAAELADARGVVERLDRGPSGSEDGR